MNWSSKIIVSNHDKVKSNQKKLVNMVLVDDEQFRNLVRKSRIFGKKRRVVTHCTPPIRCNDWTNYRYHYS